MLLEHFLVWLEIHSGEKKEWLGLLLCMIVTFFRQLATLKNIENATMRNNIGILVYLIVVRTRLVRQIFFGCGGASLPFPSPNLASIHAG